MTDPLLTVVTPSFNQGQFIRATIESVLSQDYPAIEYIIMDGGSTDETASVVKDYSSRVTFISEKDRGQSHAINKGFKMAKGDIVSWLNSDDLYLPGAARSAVAAWRDNPKAGAIYGEGYLIDRDGNTTSRFPCTEPFNLWKLVHLSDYVLQQTVYFPKDILDQIGYLDESLHYVMDWDILIRIGLQHPLLYVPEYMGCLREYAEAKSFAGGARRAREILEMLRRHTGQKLPPGYIVYGLETYQKIWCDRAERICGPVKPLARGVQRAVRLAAGLVIGRTIVHSQGLYSDGWAGRVLRYMFPPGGAAIAIQGFVPSAVRGQSLRVYANGTLIGGGAVGPGEFRMEIDVPPELQNRTLRLTIEAAKSFMPVLSLRSDSRRLAYEVKSIRWADVDPPDEKTLSRRTSAGCGSPSDSR